MGKSDAARAGATKGKTPGIEIRDKVNHEKVIVIRNRVNSSKRAITTIKALWTAPARVRNMTIAAGYKNTIEGESREIKGD